MIRGCVREIAAHLQFPSTLALPKILSGVQFWTLRNMKRTWKRWWACKKNPTPHPSPKSNATWKTPQNRIPRLEHTEKGIPCRTRREGCVERWLTMAWICTSQTNVRKPPHGDPSSRPALMKKSTKKLEHIRKTEGGCRCARGIGCSIWSDLRFKREGIPNLLAVGQWIDEKKQPKTEHIWRNRRGDSQVEFWG